MNHIARVYENQNMVRPFLVECSCGTAGSFYSESEARAWMQTKHFDRLTGICVGQFFSEPSLDEQLTEALLPPTQINESPDEPAEGDS